MNTCCAFLGTVSPCCFSDYFNLPLRNIKPDRNLVMTGSFFVVQFADDVRDAYEKKLPVKYQQKAIVDYY